MTIGAILLAGLLAIPDTANAIQCRVRAPRINFGTYMPLTPTPVDVIGRFVVRCNGSPGPFSVLIGPGRSGDQAARTLLAGGGFVLSYNLYRDAARTQIWGDGTPPTFVVNGARTSGGRPTRVNLPVYGRIFAGQTPEPGRYRDRLLVTVLF